MAATPLPTPPGASWGYTHYFAEGSLIVAVGAEQRVVFRDDGETVTIEESCGIAETFGVGVRALSARGFVIGQTGRENSRGELIFVNCSDEPVVEHRVQGASDPSAYWLGHTVQLVGNTVASQCARNKWCPGSMPWTLIVALHGEEWVVEAELPYGAHVLGRDQLVAVGDDGIHWYTRKAGAWSRCASGKGRATRMALDGDRLAVGSLGEVVIYERRGGTVEEAGRVRVAREGTYPSFDLSLSGDLLAVGTNQKVGRVDGGVLVYRRHVDGVWREHLRLAGKAYGRVILEGERLIFKPTSATVEVVRIPAALTEECVALGPKGMPEGIQVVWASPLEKKRRHFLARLGEGWGVCTKVGRRWAFVEGEPSELVAMLPAEWQADAGEAL